MSAVPEPLSVLDRVTAADADPGARLQRAMDLAYRYLGHRARTVAEVRRHLEAKRCEPAAIDGARARAMADAAPLLANVTTETRVGDLPYFKGTGCDACAGTGLKGRQGLYEVMVMTPRLRRLVLTGGDATQIRDLAVEEGMLTLRMDGWLKVLKGITKLEQVIRETSA